MRWLTRFLGGSDPDDDPLVRVAEGIGEPEARMWQETLRREGIPSLVKSPSALLGDVAYTTVDFAVWTKTSDEERAREIIGR